MTTEEPQPTFQVTINVQIEKRNHRGGYEGERLTTNEVIYLDLTSFTDIAAVLGQFHELAQDIRKIQAERG